MRFEKRQFLSLPVRGASELQTRHGVGVQEADTLQSWFLHKNDFLEQKAKLEKSKMSETKTSHTSALPFLREPRLCQRTQAFQGKTVAGGRQVPVGKLPSEPLVVVICTGALEKVCPGSPSTGPPKSASLMP